MGTFEEHKNAYSIAKKFHICGNKALTVTFGLNPDVRHTVVELIDQHEPITVQQDVLAAFIAMTHLKTHAKSLLRT